MPMILAFVSKAFILFPPSVQALHENSTKKKKKRHLWRNFLTMIPTPNNIGIADPAGARTVGPRVSVPKTNDTKIVPPVLIPLKNLQKKNG